VFVFIDYFHSQAFFSYQKNWQGFLIFFETLWGISGGENG